MKIPQTHIREKKAHQHKLFALVNVQIALGQTGGCPRVNRAKKFMGSARNTGNTNFSLWLTGGLSQGCPDFQKVYVFKVYVPFSCPIIGNFGHQQILENLQSLRRLGRHAKQILAKPKKSCKKCSGNSMNMLQVPRRFGHHPIHILEKT